MDANRNRWGQRLPIPSPVSIPACPSAGSQKDSVQAARHFKAKEDISQLSAEASGWSTSRWPQQRAVTSADVSPEWRTAIKNPPKGARTWQPHSAGPEHATNPTRFWVRLDSIKKIEPWRRTHLDGVMGCLLAHGKTQILRHHLFLKHRANCHSSGICERQVPRSWYLTHLALLACRGFLWAS